jgi:hypothetical protein
MRVQLHLNHSTYPSRRPASREPAFRHPRRGDLGEAKRLRFCGVILQAMPSSALVTCRTDLPTFVKTGCAGDDMRSAVISDA